MNLLAMLAAMGRAFTQAQLTFFRAVGRVGVQKAVVADLERVVVVREAIARTPPVYHDISVFVNSSTFF